ncbi:MAG TPA: right-handed parallel beta-helix repeat-containing protein [Nitrososphaera sp.]|nr:right-handed parallel beta-helix repeat-containing protein [Nitrososphaera sp.]
MLHVSESNDHFRSISEAAQNANEGDQIVVASGVYSPSTTKESFPIYIPPRCQLMGSGADGCQIDGGGAKEIADRPLDPSQSLVLLGNNSVLSGLTICNSGSNGVSNEHGARILVTDSVVRDNGQHGLLVFGTNSAVIYNNDFVNNGVKKREYKGPRSEVPAKQGHHLYVESRSGCTNEVVIVGNRMEKVFADGIANDVFDQPEGVSMRIQIIGNTISKCGRNGLSISSSYGPSNTNVFVEIRKNRILQTTNAIDILAPYAVVRRAIRNAKLSVNITQNKIDSCDTGISVIGAISPAIDTHAICNIIGNTIDDAKQYGILAVAGYGMDNWSVENTVLDLIIASNKFNKVGKRPIFIQGGASVNKEVVRNNIVYAHLVDNQINTERDVVVNDGLPTNSVVVLEGSQPHSRQSGVLTF